MKKHIIPLLLLLAVACQEASQDTETKRPELEELRTEALAKTEFQFVPDHDTMLSGQKGTILQIPADAFVDSNGILVKEPIRFEMKECLNKQDMLLSGLTTTSNGAFLESGGMLYLNARTEGGPVFLAKGKAIGVSMPADTILDGMMLFEGEPGASGINWVNPIVLAHADKQPAVEMDENLEIIAAKNEQDGGFRCNVGYYVRDFNYFGPWGSHRFMDSFIALPPSLVTEIGNICWANCGLIISKDSVIQIDTFEVALIRMDTMQQIGLLNQQGQANLQWDLPAGTSNNFEEDEQIRYNFSVLKLGWANIDRLFDDPRCQDVILIVDIKNWKEYDRIYTSMIFSDRMIYLPGYQKEDKSFSFTHGDFESPRLPKGAEAYILVKAYKGDEVFFALHRFTIKEKEAIELSLQQTTLKEINSRLLKEFKGKG